MRLRSLIPYAFSGSLVIIAAHYGVARSLGAHPFWDQNIALTGTPIGLVAAAVLRAMRWRWTTRLFAFLVSLTLAGTAAHQGRLAFAASFAENTLAGQVWYVGWIACAAGAAGFIASLLTPRKTKT